MSAKIRINSDSSLVEIETPEGDIYGPMEMPTAELEGEDADPILLLDEDNPYIATVSEHKGLKAHTVYRLVPVETTLELNVEMEEEDDEEEENEDGGVVVDE
jgi:hypothetical protein